MKNQKKQNLKIFFHRFLAMIAFVVGFLLGAVLSGLNSYRMTTHTTTPVVLANRGPLRADRPAHYDFAVGTSQTVSLNNKYAEVLAVNSDYTIDIVLPNLPFSTFVGDTVTLYLYHFIDTYVGAHALNSHFLTPATEPLVTRAFEGDSAKLLSYGSASIIGVSLNVFDNIDRSHYYHILPLNDSQSFPYYGGTYTSTYVTASTPNLSFLYTVGMYSALQEYASNFNYYNSISLTYYGYNPSYDHGYELGYSAGLTAPSFLDTMKTALDSVASLLSIQVFPNITVGTLIFIPLAFAVLLFILKLGGN